MTFCHNLLMTLSQLCRNVVMTKGHDKRSWQRYDKVMIKGHDKRSWLRYDKVMTKGHDKRSWQRYDKVMTKGHDKRPWQRYDKDVTRSSKGYEKTSWQKVTFKVRLFFCVLTWPLCSSMGSRVGKVMTFVRNLVPPINVDFGEQSEQGYEQISKMIFCHNLLSWPFVKSYALGGLDKYQFKIQL